MKISFEKVLNPEGCSFSLTDKSEPRFDGQYHFHPEIELTLITAGTGTRLVGDAINRFGPGDCVLVGKDLPHQYVSNDDDGEALHKAKVIQFKEDFLGSELTIAPELRPIQGLWGKAKSGLSIVGPSLKKTTQLIDHIFEYNGIRRLLKLIELLDFLSISEDLSPIASSLYESSLSTKESHKIDKALLYLRERIDQQITLDDLSRHLNVSTPTCNRLLNKSFKKSFKTLLIEMRISQACRLLIETSQSVLDIALACGFPNLSNFNRRFKSTKGATPTEYRKKRQKMDTLA